jgi:hypothetical protein
MKKFVFAAAVVAMTAVTSVAMAEDSHGCSTASQDKWMSKDALKAKVAALGYDVRKIKIEGTCYEVYAINAKGAKVEELFNPETGEKVGDEGAE